MGNRYFKQTDTRVNMYYVEHKDMFKQLKPNILAFYKKYMNDYAIQRLTSIRHIEENGYTFKGVTNDWITDYSKIKFKVNSMKVSEVELKKYMPLQTIFIKSVIYSIYTDLQYLTYLELEGYTEDYKRDYTKDIDLVLSSNSTSTEIDYCRKFHALGLGIPALLQTEYNKLYSQVVLANKCRKFYENIGEDYDSYKELNVKLIENINTQVLDGKIEEGNTGLALIAKAFKTAYFKCVNVGIETVESLVGMSKRVVYRTQAANGLRLATKGEIESRVPQLVEEEQCLIAQTNYIYLLTFVYFCTGNEKILGLINVNCDLKDILAMDTVKLLTTIVKYMNSGRFDKDLIKMQSVKEVRYPKTAVDEIRDIALLDKLKMVHETLSKNKDTLSQYDKMALDIANKGLSGKDLSNKQINVLNMLYNDIVTGVRKDNLYTQEVENMIVACKSYFSYKGSPFYISLFDSLLKYKKCSEKQLKCVQDEYNRMLEHQKIVLERESQYVVKNTRQRKADENAALNDLNLKMKQQEEIDNKEEAKIPTLIFGDYVFEDVED